MITMEAARTPKQKRDEMGDFSQYGELSKVNQTESFAQYGVLSEEKSSKGLMSKETKPVEMGIVPDSAYSMISSSIGVGKSTWDIFREEVAKIESAGDYSVKGGYNNHYDGRYQLGKDAKTDAATLLGYSLKHDPTSRKKFRGDKKKQEEAFAAFTVKNHGYLMSKSKKYRGLSTEDKLATLAYAHNQGWSLAKNWLDTGAVGADAFGTKGTKYSTAIKNALAKVGTN